MKHLLVLLIIPVAVVTQGMLISVPGRLVVEPTQPATLGDVLALTLVNSQGTVTADITLREGIKASSFGNSVRGGVSGEFLLRPDGTFQTYLPRGEHRLIVRRQSGPNAPAHYVKSVFAGSVNLLEKPLTVQSPFAGEIVITLGKCTADTRQEC